MKRFVFTCFVVGLALSATTTWANQMNPALNELPSIEIQTELEEEAGKAFVLVIVGLASLALVITAPVSIGVVIFGMVKAHKVMKRYREQFPEETYTVEPGYKKARLAKRIGWLLFAAVALFLGGLYFYYAVIY